MGEVASVVKALSCDSCAKYVCNSASMHSQCCEPEGDGCNCDVKTEPTILQPIDEDLQIEMDNGCEGLCCNCIMRAHK